jgi:GMP synthase-like glutamine amidotransferase
MTKLAILDLYDGEPNQGMRCIQEIVSRFDTELEWQVFDVRGKAQVPDLSFDIFISTGGPGSPLDGDGRWDKRYFNWLDSVWNWNKNPENPRKFVFFICHSFQMAVHHFQLAQVIRRRSMSFGTFPVHLTRIGLQEPLFQGLNNPFFAADFRHWQVIQPKRERFFKLGASILAIEKERPHIPLERAVMAIRFSPEMLGVQFHPEADPEGMIDHFQHPERRDIVIDEHGLEKYQDMIDHLNDEDKIPMTHDIILPSFIRRSLQAIGRQAVLV